MSERIKYLSTLSQIPSNLYSVDHTLQQHTQIFHGITTKEFRPHDYDKIKSWISILRDDFNSEVNGICSCVKSLI